MRSAQLVGLALVALLVLAPAADALNIAARSVKARSSEDYPESAWSEGYYGCGVTIAIFDEGVDDKHPYLDGKVIAGVDTTDTSQFWTLANGGNPQPLQGTHGTPVAGIAVSHAGQPFFAPEDAPEYPEDALVGLAPCAWMVDVQFNDVNAIKGFDQRVIDAFQWAIDNKDNDWGDSDPSNDGIDVITMSWSPYDQTDGSDPISQIATAAVDAGIVVLGSAGNSGFAEEPDIGTPSGADGTLAIANLWNERTVTRNDDVIEGHSTWGPRADDGDDDLYEELKPDVAAPGTGVVSTGDALADGTEYQLVCIGYDEPLGPQTGCERSFGGTSAATPLVAGIVALMLQANPSLTPADVKEILHQTAQMHKDQEADSELNAKWHHQYGYGMVDAHAAVKLAENWVGLERGRDLDSDGVVDLFDAMPTDPSVAKTLSPDDGGQDAPGAPAALLAMALLGFIAMRRRN